MLRGLGCVILAASVLVALPGCSGSVKTAKMVDVKGTVNLDGAPMAEGEISFALPGLPPTLLEVKNGSYAGKAAEGDNRVEIRAYKEGTPVDMGGEKFGGGKENYLPAQFNSESTFTAKVAAGGANEFKFDVTSQ